MKFTFELLPYQLEFLKAKEKFVWLCAGLGAGKSFTLAHYIIQRMLTNPETIGLVCASTYSQLRDSILAELFRQLQLMGLAYDYSAQTGFLQLKCNGARIKTFSLENYEVLRGIEVGWIAIDEACLAKEEAFNVALGRLRCRHSRSLDCRIVSTPRGFDYLYQRFVGEAKTAQHRLIHATALENFYLPEGYIESLAAAYTPKMYRQEVLAEFVSNAEGNVYYAFDRTEHATRPVPQVKGYPIWVGMDFNVNPMTAVLCNVTGGSLHVFDEVYLKHSNTFDVVKAVRDKYPHESCIIAPDATGGARKTSSTKSDHAILRDAGFKVVTSRSNPAVEDRYNTVNARLREGRIEVDPSCKMLVRDLERVTHESNPEYLTHISDALGYVAWRVMPLKSRPPQPQVIHR